MSHYVYILTNFGNAVLYTGVTNDLGRRTYEHREKLIEGFTKKYNVWKLVHFEDVVQAIAREKQIKAGPRRKKLELVRMSNPTSRDPYPELFEGRRSERLPRPALACLAMTAYGRWQREREALHFLSMAGWETCAEAPAYWVSKAKGINFIQILRFE